MVPVRLEPVDIPNIMKIMALCDFTKRDLRDWAWVRLAQSIKVPLNPCDFEVCYLSNIIFFEWYIL